MTFPITLRARPECAATNLDALHEALARRLPVTHEQRQAEFQAAMRYRSALGLWYAGLFSAARKGESFERPRPEPQDFSASRYGAY